MGRGGSVLNLDLKVENGGRLSLTKISTSIVGTKRKWSQGSPDTLRREVINNDKFRGEHTGMDTGFTDVKDTLALQDMEKTLSYIHNSDVEDRV